MFLIFININNGSLSNFYNNRIEAFFKLTDK